MSADLNQLVPEFREKVIGVLTQCRAAGHELRPFFTLRGTVEQSRLWRQSRPIEEIEAAAEMLRREGAGRLAQILLEVGPQAGKWATNALPGQSWHQWGEAVDCVVIESGHAVWATRLRRNGEDLGPQPGYLAYAEAARAAGLDAGYWWKNVDAVHVQARTATVRSLYSWAQMEDEMFKRFPQG